MGSKLPLDAGVVRLTRDSLDEIARLAGMLEDNPLPTRSILMTSSYRPAVG